MHSDPWMQLVGLTPYGNNLFRICVTIIGRKSDSDTMPPPIGKQIDETQSPAARCGGLSRAEKGRSAGREGDGQPPQVRRSTSSQLSWQMRATRAGG